MALAKLAMVVPACNLPCASKQCRMISRLLCLPGCFIVCALTAGVAAGKPGPARGPLHVSKESPRYFADAAGRIVYLTGSHTWPNLKDRGQTDPPEPFDWPGYLNFLAQRHHNFIRLWTWDLFRQMDAGGEVVYHSPFPWPRTGPGKALDGKPRFDLTSFQQSYFGRLRERVKAAGEHGIYVSIMLFEGWGVQFIDEAWQGHPFNLANNINGIDGDPDRTGKGLAVYTLQAPTVTRVQEAYVRKVIDTVNDLDNVLYEICNESHPGSTEWQYQMVRSIKEYEAAKPKQHPVGMTGHDGGPTNEELFASPADWVSPGQYPDEEGQDYCANLPPADGRKVILLDTDHLWGVGGSQAWVWKSFCRGMNPIFMDPYLRDGHHQQPARRLDPKWDPVRNSLGYARRFAERMNLAKATPSVQLASSGFCLAAPGAEYLVYLPEGGAVSVDLSVASGQLTVEWFDPSRVQTHSAKPITGGGNPSFHAPFDGDAILYLRRR